jgi:hypothetical protein
MIRLPNVPASDAVVSVSCDNKLTTPSTSACSTPASPSYDRVVPDPEVAATNVQLAVGFAVAVTLLTDTGVPPLAVNAVYTVALVVNVLALRFAGFAGANLPRIVSILSKASSARSPDAMPDTFPLDPPYAVSVGVPMMTIPPEIYDDVSAVVANDALTVLDDQLDVPVNVPINEPLNDPVLI